MYRPIRIRLWCAKQHCRSISASRPSYDHPSNLNSADWNSNDEFFKFTRSRFLVDESENLKKREIQFNMNELAKVAADKIGANKCVSIRKYPDGMYNKAYLLSMEDGQEVVAKVPNPNAGIPHFTTASEVATMNFAREVLRTPVPHVYSWNSHSQSHPVGAEFIIMDKARGVPLSQEWDTMKLPQKLQVLLAMTHLQKQWLSVSFSHYGSLYYAKDLQLGDVPPSEGSHFIKNGKTVEDSEFSIGPTTGRDWMDAGRSTLDIARGPWTSAAQYLQAVGVREIKATQSMRPPKQLALLCGPKLYQPDAEKKLTALRWYQQMIDALAPMKDTAIIKPYLWHNDLHDENIYVNPHNPGEITDIIDWQACHISALFNHNPIPAFIAWEDGFGPEPETLDLAPRPKLSGLSQEEISKAVHDYSIQNVFIGWQKLMHSKNPDMYKVVKFQKTTLYELIFLAHRMFEYGEVHFQSLLVEMQGTWAAELPAVTSNDVPFPFEFLETDTEHIGQDSDGAVAGIELLMEMKETMGALWPDKGLIEHERYDECKSALNEMKTQAVEQLAETDEEKVEYERHWPFD